MKPSLVDEIIWIILQVLTAVLMMSCASNVVKENSNSNDPIYSNNQNYMGILMLSLNELANHSVNQMWKLNTLKRVKCPQCLDDVTEMSVQLKHSSIRISKITTMQSNKNMYTKTPAMDMCTTSINSSTYCKSKYRSKEKKNVHEKKKKREVYVQQEKVSGRMYCTYDGFDLKCIFKKQKHSVCTSIQVDVGVIVISAPQSNGICKWFSRQERKQHLL
ncbi:hypothetical protein RFI_33916 [Reticulomyxa filosa]|uniref:Uncharacterized protein n=1 Tax=Reticulomyxa filosa TaxID=46433 RepID=X6LRX1_RETFI|nr:hypothetical protein RFI_33916 [Reticulomyxa filosa]|eukprot:ETO03490.1 hypothetical protein RFI_33916 [Reticulomyxa filosa]